jgi:hypothetical protein
MDHDSKVAALRAAIRALAGTPHAIVLEVMLKELERQDRPHE